MEILVFDGCPSAKLAEQLVQDTVNELEMVVDIELLNVADNEDAVTKRFLGSPSIRINGKDIEIDEDGATQYSMPCQVYWGGGHMGGVPPKALPVSTLKKASQFGHNDP